MPRFEDAQIALSFKSLAHPRRVRLFRMIADAAPSGAGFQALSRATGWPSSSLVHHLRELERTGLVRRARRGPRVHYAITPNRFTAALREALNVAATGRRGLERAA